MQVMDQGEGRVDIVGVEVVVAEEVVGCQLHDDVVSSRPSAK